jgi:acyl-CoA synthetase (AMP-forming)/AMP-acid ligase II
MHPGVHARTHPDKPAYAMAGGGRIVTYRDAEELIAFCRRHLSPIKCPRSIDFDAALPRHPTGKLYKRLSKDRYRAGHQTRIL